MPAQRLIGTDPDQISLNGMLGRMAFLDPRALPELGLASGSEGAPSLYFTEDVDLGMCRVAANTWGIVAGGLVQVRINDGTAPLEERYATAFHPVVTGVDIGSDPDEISLNGMLGLLAFEDEVTKLRPSGSTPVDNLDINFEYVSDTSLKIRMRGADGTVRSVTLTLA